MRRNMGRLRKRAAPNQAHSPERDLLVSSGPELDRVRRVRKIHPEWTSNPFRVDLRKYMLSCESMVLFFDCIKT